MDRFNRLPTVVLPAFTLILALVLPAVLSGYQLSHLSHILIWALFAMGFNVVFGWGGMASLGHAAFFGLSSYAISIAVNTFNVDLLASFVLGVLMSAALGAVFGFFTQKVSGVYLLLLTLVMAQSVWALAFYFSRYTQGDMGLYLTLSGWAEALQSDVVVYYVVVGAVVVTALGLRVLELSVMGTAIRGLRESPSRMTSLGYSKPAIQIFAFTMSGAIAGLAGGLNVVQLQYVSPHDLEWLTSATVLLMVIVGGASRRSGPFVGAFIILGLEVLLSQQTERWMTILGVIYIVVALFLPDGVMGGLSRLWASVLNRLKLRRQVADA